jgi:pSer/pThr/pTyr-binding forkhead associated (FHA) protein
MQNRGETGSMEKVTCVRCGHENESGVERCVKCSAPLPVPEATTREMTTPSAPASASDNGSDQPGEAIVLYFLGSQEPLTVQPRAEIIIGRSVMGESESVLDLTPYGADEKGVSRKHAKIIYKEGKYHLVDLESTNGTWVNEQKLTATEVRMLHSTDMIRFGNLSMFIYFKPASGKPAEAVDESHRQIDRIDLAWPAENLTPGHLVNLIGPFLEAIANLQQLRNEALAVEKPKPVVLHALSAGPPISVVIENARPTLELTSLILATLRDEKLVAREHETPPADAGITTLPTGTRSLDMTSDYDIARRRLIEIAHRTLDQMAAKKKIEEPDRTDYVIRLLGILHTFEKAELTIFSVSPVAPKKK